MCAQNIDAQTHASGPQTRPWTYSVSATEPMEMVEMMTPAHEPSGTHAKAARLGMNGPPAQTRPWTQSVSATKPMEMREMMTPTHESLGNTCKGYRDGYTSRHVQTPLGPKPSLNSLCECEEAYGDGGDDGAYS